MGSEALMSTQLVDRRTMLKGGLAVGVAFSVGVSLSLPAPSEGMRVLSPRECELVAAIALTLFPKGHFPLDGVEAGVVEEVDRYIAEDLTGPTRVGLRYLLRSLELGTVAARGRRFSSLSAEERTEVLDVWASPGLMPRRIGFDAIKMVFGMAYFSNPDVLAHIGYRNACSGGIS